MQTLIDQGLAATADLWPDIRVAFGWVHEAAHVLGTTDATTPATIQDRLGGLLDTMVQHRDQAGDLAEAVDHFVKVTHSYWSGLFHCYAVPDLPRTNNDLEQWFGSHRYHERRATGRKGASPALVLRGAVRLLAAAATRERPITVAELAAANRDDWQRLRHKLDQRRQQRRQRSRFRRNPKEYLNRLEAQLLQPALPS